ncbi:rhomboid family intramembrane serine protease [Chloroflexota bacterium]
MSYRTYQGFKLNSILIIIGINLLLFVAIDLFLKNIDTNLYIQLISRLGLVPDIFWSQPWTIVTNMFIHAGFWHIFGNMITLFFFGGFLSRLVGNNKFLLVYFTGGVLGNILYILLGEPLSIAVGASGAVYAVAGALVVMMPNIRVLIWGIIPMRLWVAVLVFFVIWSIPDFIPGIAWEAHLGGLIFGLIAGYFFRRRARRLFTFRY